MIEGIIFDVDGTLWDPTEEVAYSWNQAIKEQTDMDRTLTAEQLKREFGKPLEEIIDDLFPELAQIEQESLADHLYKYENKWVETAPCIVYDQMAETVRELSKSISSLSSATASPAILKPFLRIPDLDSILQIIPARETPES